MCRGLLLCSLFLAGPVLAQWGSDARDVTLYVGETAHVDVFHAGGLNCDDLDMVDAKLVTSKDKKHNTLVIKAKAPGSTYCRAGQPALGYTVLVHIVVEEKD